MAAYTFQMANDLTLTDGVEPESVRAVQASGNLFPLLGVKPLLGRFYSPEEEKNKSAVALLSESLWRSRYGSDASIIGRKIRIIHSLVTVVGVVPQRSAEPDWAEVWIPMSNLDIALTKTRRFHVLEVIARLRAGVNVAQAQAEMNRLAANLARTYPATNGQVGVSVRPLSLWATGEIRPALLIAGAAVSLILVLACANVAHLVLVRTVQRSRELAVRAALGADPARIGRLLLAEHMLLALSGGVLGFILSRGVLPLLWKWTSVDVWRPSVSELSPFALILGGLAALLCMGVFAFPAVLHSRRLDIQQAIKQSSGLSLSHRRSWFGSSVIAVEIALAFAVITGAGLLYKSFSALLHEKTGFDSSNVLAVELPLALDWNRSVTTFEQKIAPRLRQIPGVTSAAAVNCGPMMLHSSDITRYTIPLSRIRPISGIENFPIAQLRWATPEYFKTLHIPLKQGRLFTLSDIGKPAYVVNEALARQYFPRENPIGQQLWTGITGRKAAAAPIIGVVGDVRDLGLDREPGPTLYQLGVSNWMTLLIRSDVPSTTVAASVRRAIRAVSPEDAIARLAPLDQIIQSSIDRSRFELELLAAFAVLGGMLAAIGILGVIGYSLNERKNEFAVRLALGAERRDIWLLVLRGFLPCAVMGLVAGVWLALGFASVLRSQLHKVTPADPTIFLASSVCLLIIVVTAAIGPIAKAAGIPVTSLLREP